MTPGAGINTFGPGKGGNGRTVMATGDEPEDAFDRVVDVVVVGCELVRRKVRGNNKAAGHGRTPEDLQYLTTVYPDSV